MSKPHIRLHVTSCGWWWAENYLDCPRNSPENRKAREAFGQCLPGGYTIDTPPTAPEKP